MSSKNLDFYIDRPSPLHRAPAITKLLAALCIVIATALMPKLSWTYFGSLAIFLLLVVVVSRLPLHRILFRVALFEPFVVGVAVLTLFQSGGLWIFLGVIAKSSLCLFTMMILTATTSFADILQALSRLRVPSLMITTLALMYRYLFLLMDEMGRMKRARASRSFSPKQRRGWYALSTIIAELFIRTSLRAERVYSAMCARGWNA